MRLMVPVAPAEPEPELAGDVRLVIRFRPGTPSTLTEILIEPEAPTAQQEADLLAEAYVRLAEYVTGFLGAFADDLTAQEG